MRVWYTDGKCEDAGEKVIRKYKIDKERENNGTF